MSETDRKAHEPSRDVPVSGVYDVVVCGGGPAGIAAALAAARCNASVLLIEAHGCLGGVWTAGALSWIIDAANKPGLMHELMTRMARESVSEPVAPGVGSFAYDPESMKLLLEQWCVEEGVSVRLHTRIAAVLTDDSRRVTHVVTESKSGREAWIGSLFVDATGDGDAAALAGCKYEMGRPENGETQPMSLMALLTGLDFRDVGRYCMNNGLPEDGRKLLLAEMARAGVEPSYAAPTLIHIRDTLFALMANHEYGVQATDAAAITNATIRARMEVHRLAAGLKTLGGGWSAIRIVGTAGQIGVREGRRIRGRYTVSAEDAIRGARFEDGIARVTFWTDIHSTNPKEGKGYGSDGVRSQPYDIPLRSLIAADVDGLLLAGRCISGDFITHASYRVTGNAVAMGEAAGVTAALAARLGVLPQQVPWPLVKERLKVESH